MDSWSAAFFNLAMYASSSSTLSHVTCTTSPLLLLPTIALPTHSLKKCVDQETKQNARNSRITASPEKQSLRRKTKITRRMW